MNENADLSKFSTEELTEYRNYVEGLLNQRFHFFLLFVTIFMASYGIQMDLLVRILFIIVSIFIASDMSDLVSRSQNQIDFVLDKLRSRNGTLEHTLNGGTQAATASKRRKLRSMSKLLYWLVLVSGPVFLVSSFVPIEAELQSILEVLLDLSGA